jgi:hypothetical protein
LYLDTYHKWLSVDTKEMTFMDNKVNMDRCFKKISEISWPRSEKIYCFEHQEYTALRREIDAEAKIVKRKKNTKGEYSTTLKKTEAKERLSIVWYRQQRLKIAATIAELKLENEQIPIEVREAEEKEFKAREAAEDKAHIDGILDKMAEIKRIV